MVIEQEFLQILRGHHKQFWLAPWAPFSRSWTLTLQAYNIQFHSYIRDYQDATIEFCIYIED